MAKQQKAQSGRKTAKKEDAWPEEPLAADAKGISPAVMAKVLKLSNDPQRLLRFVLIYFVEQWSVEQAAGATQALDDINAKLKQLHACQALTGKPLAWATASLQAHFLENVQGFLQSGGEAADVQEVLEAVTESLDKRDLDTLRTTAQRMCMASTPQEQEAWASMYDSAMMAAATADGDEGSIQMLEERRTEREATAVLRHSTAAAATTTLLKEPAAGSRKHAAGQVQPKTGSKSQKALSKQAEAQALAARSEVAAAKAPSAKNGKPSVTPFFTTEQLERAKAEIVRGLQEEREAARAGSPQPQVADIAGAGSRKGKKQRVHLPALQEPTLQLGEEMKERLDASFDAWQADRAPGAVKRRRRGETAVA